VSVEGVRPVTYGVGRVLHVGSRQVDTGLDFVTLDVVDHGALLTTMDGGVWFSDGDTVERVGTTLTGRVRPHSITWFVARPEGWVRAGPLQYKGWLAAWMEFAAGDVHRPELVVFDAAKREVVARRAVDVGPRTTVRVLGVTGGAAYVITDTPGRDDQQVLRLSTHSWGRLHPVDLADFEVELRADSRLVVGDDPGTPLTTYREGDGAVNQTDRVPVRDGRLTSLSLDHSGARVDLRLPADVDPETHAVHLVQWVDEDRFAVVDSPRADQRLLVCDLSRKRCEVALDATGWDVPPQLGGDGGPAGELALARAVNVG
jgi:hypothetical protein